MKELIELFLLFAKIGVMTFGGGYAMLPIIVRELSEKRNMVTEAEILDYFAVAQCTPGVIAVNTATFVGRKRKGIAGGIAATLGVVFPSIVIITLISAFLGNISDIPWVKSAFNGIRACVCVLILNAVIKLIRKNQWNIFRLFILCAVFLLSMFFSVSPVIFVIGSAILGIIYKATAKEEAKK